MTCFPKESKAQEERVFGQVYTTWPVSLREVEGLTLRSDTNVIIIITEILVKDLDTFLEKSLVKSDTIAVLLKDLIGGGRVTIDTLRKTLTIAMGEIYQKEGFKNRTITAQLVKGEDTVSIVIRPKEVVAGTPISGGDATISNTPYLFIPEPDMERMWALQITPKQSVKLNYHTRWAIVYDFSKDDPVSIYKRLNTVIGNTCDGVLPETQRRGKKNKLSGVLKEIVELDKQLAGIQEKAIDSRAELRLVKIKKDLQRLSDGVSPTATEQQLDAIAKELDVLKKELDITKSLYPLAQFTAVTNKVLPPQCDNIYKIKEVRKLSPTVNRSLLIVVPHYHPYRDSIVLSADYGNRFLQDAALFNSTFMGSTGMQAGEESDKAKKGLVHESLGKGPKDKPALTPLQLFTKLRNELRKYADEKMKTENLDVEVVENGVAYIKEQMTEHLDITDFSATGILKAAEQKAKDVDKSELESYFKIVHEVVDLFVKIASYKRYNNHNILIENKDLISLTLNRYRDGRLATMNKEAVRSYYTAGGVKVDFSVGLFGGSLVNKGFTTKTEWFSDTSYVRGPNGVVDTTIESIDSVQRKRIIKEDNGNFTIGPAIMTHIYWRSGTDVNFSATLGIAINQQALPRYLFGGSVMFGRDSRWVFSSGVALGPIKDLAGGYKVGDVVKLDELNTIPLKDVWKSSVFLSLTFNMGGFNVGGR
jgi:hypothetical protein